MHQQRLQCSAKWENREISGWLRSRKELYWCTRKKFRQWQMRGMRGFRKRNPVSGVRKRDLIWRKKFPQSKSWNLNLGHWRGQLMRQILKKKFAKWKIFGKSRRCCRTPRSNSLQSMRRQKEKPVPLYTLAGVSIDSRRKDKLRFGCFKSRIEEIKFCSRYLHVAIENVVSSQRNIAHAICSCFGD